MESLKKYGRQMVATVLVTTGVIGSVAALQRPTAEPLSLVMPTPSPTVAPTFTATPSPVVVFVSGEVAAPGVYALAPGSRVVDAIVAAGGLSSDADADAVNQAVLLEDGMQIHVPGQGENATPVPLSRGGENSSAAQNEAKLNINLATALELEELPEIGPSLAEAIVRYRETNGAFQTIEALLDVPGIGESKLNAIRELITIE